MLACFQNLSTDEAIPIYLLTQEQWPTWFASQTAQRQNWIARMGFGGKSKTFCLLSNDSGEYSGVVFIIDSEQDIFSVGSLPLTLPFGLYYLETHLNNFSLQQALIAWGLGAYQFTRYKAISRDPAQLILPRKVQIDLIENVIESTYLVRDLINTPAEDMGPLELAEIAVELGKKYGAEVKQIVSEALLDEVYPAIYTVGRAGATPPRLIDIVWGDEKLPKLTLVGKGVCFDTGGLNLKSGDGMRLMKKDMGGAAHVLGLARMIMQANLPVRLRVLIPAVENAVSGHAYRPGDVITMRNGLTVEVNDTDAEGRLILADALVEAARGEPELLVDFATLTGAARVAVGTEIAAFFANREELAKRVLLAGEQHHDPVWRLPFYQAYTDLLKSSVADLANCANTSYAGAITAALFLQHFVPREVEWLHFDVMAWNVINRPAHPEGGEAMGLRALFDYLRQRFSSRH